jgi:5-amino-6-(5-phosphoribosylamino)uracil reductase
VTSRPYVLLSCAASIDGHIDDTAGSRLILSNDADFERVDEVRASCDAIMVGATTIRKDNPRLLVRSQVRQNARTARGTTPTPVKVTITGHGDLDPAANFCAAGDTRKIVCAASPALDKARERVGAVASVADAGDPADLHRILADLNVRGIGRLMVEGGGTMHTQFPAAGLADELHLVIAPFFVGDTRAPRFVHDAYFRRTPATAPGSPKSPRLRMSSCSVTRYPTTTPDHEGGLSPQIRDSWSRPQASVAAFVLKPDSLISGRSAACT